MSAPGGLLGWADMRIWSVFILLAGGCQWLAAAELKFDFGRMPLGQPPPGFRSTVVGTGKPGDWQVIEADFPSLLKRFDTNAPTLVARRASPERMVLVGAAAGFVSGARSYTAEPVPANSIVIHGELDETVPLANVLAWARPQDLAVVVIPGADHFFHRRLHIIKNIIKGSWKS